MAHRYVFGLLAPRCTAHARTVWNELLREHAVDGFFDFYRTTTSKDLETKLSEMFLLERRGYLIHESLQGAAVALMDHLAPSALKRGLVDMVKNERGVLVGYFLGDSPKEEILKLWMT